MNRQVSASSAPAAVSSRRIAVVLLALAVSSFSSAATLQTNAGPTRAPKNVILMISDGTGVNTIAATGMYADKLGKQAFDGPNWLKAFASTYPLRTGGSPLPGPAGLQQDPDALYDPAKNWDTTPANTITGRYPDHFAGYRWTKATAPDSANTMVAVVSGHKTYNAAVNVDGNGKRLLTFAELERMVDVFAREPNGGLIVLPDVSTLAKSGGPDSRLPRAATNSGWRSMTRAVIACGRSSTSAPAVTLCDGTTTTF